VARFAVILPAYNVSEKLRQTLATLLGVLKGAGEIIVVDDGSTDETAKVAREFKTVLLQHLENQGKGAALKTGFRYALSRGIRETVVLDADGQHDPRFVPKFLEMGRTGLFDLVLGVRNFDDGGMPRDRWLSNQLSSLVVSFFCGRRIPDSQCGYRFVHLGRYPFVPLRTKRFEFESELLIRYCQAGARIGFLRIPTIYKDEPSSIRRLADTLRFLKMLAQTVIL